MKIFSSEHIFDHPWNTVVNAAWRKYPNPLKPEVIGLDVLDRRLGNDGILRTSRIIKTEWHIPSWVTRLIGLENPNYSYEYSEVNLKDQQMILKSTNLNCTNFVDIDETLTYKLNPQDPSKTLMEQSAVITVKGVPLKDYCENLMVSTWSSNAHTGRQAMEWVISHIKKEYEELTQKLSTEFAELQQPLHG
jgi:hypothetical protein